METGWCLSQNETMKFPAPIFLSACLLTGLGGQAARARDADLARFVDDREKQIRTYAETVTNPVPDIVWKYLHALKADDRDTVSNLFVTGILPASGYSLPFVPDDTLTPVLQRTPIGPPLLETYWTLRQFEDWDNRWLHRYGREIMAAVPAGSVYFGGTDAGRYLITALSDSQTDGRPFFIISQNQLIDGAYTAYLQKIYGRRLSLVTAQDSERAFAEYSADAQKRSDRGELQPGEEVHRTPEGRVAVSGQVANVKISGRLAKDIFDGNPGRDFYVDENFPFDWMQPQLVPQGPIFQLRRQPVERLDPAGLKQNTEYWNGLAGEMIGGWLQAGTPLSEVCDFAGRVYADKNPAGFTGDRGFADNEMAQACFSKLRSDQAGLFAWRAEHARSADERDVMYHAADFAFRQAYALCPSSPEALFRYTNLLLAHNRLEEAIRMAQTSQKVAPDDRQFAELTRQLLACQKSVSARKTGPQAGAGSRPTGHP